MDQQHFTNVINNAIVSRNAVTSVDRNRIYEAARNSVRRQPSHTAAMLSALEAAISSIEATFVRPAPSTLRRKGGPLVAAVALLAVGAVSGAAFARFSFSPKLNDARLEKFETLIHAYDDQVVQVPIALDFLREVIDAIVERQRSNRASLDAISNDLTPLAKFDPDLNGRLPASLPQGTAVLVRANAFNVKVLMNWTLCGAVSVSNPELLDPVRSSSSTIGCPYFGMWTAGARKW